MCDAGRYGYKFIDENRIEKPEIRANGNGEAVPAEAGWEQVLDQVAAKIKEAEQPIGVFLSPQLSNEELFLARKLFAGPGKKFQIHFLSPNPEGDQDDFLIRADKNPNTKGGELLGFKPVIVGAHGRAPLQDFLKMCEQGKIEGVFIFGQDLLTMVGAPFMAPLNPKGAINRAPTFNHLKWSVFIGSNQNLTSESSTFVLPSATYAEKNGTFTNFEGRVQKFNKAFQPLADSRPEWVILQELANRLGLNWNYSQEDEIFTELGREIKVFHMTRRHPERSDTSSSAAKPRGSLRFFGLRPQNDNRLHSGKKHPHRGIQRNG